MLKSVLVALAALALVAGCVSVTGPTASPGATAAPTGAPTGAPTAPPTSTASPSAAPTAQPTETAAPTDEPTEQPSGVDTRDLLYEDNLDDPTGQCAAPTDPTTVPVGCFGVGEVTGTNPDTQEPIHIGDIAYLDEKLNVSVDLDNGWMWSRREVGGAHSTMRVAAEFIPAAAGRFGLFCNWNDKELWGAVVGTDGSWVLGDIGEFGINRLAEDLDARLDVRIGESVSMAIECAGLITGGLRLTLWLEDTGPVAIYETDQGPDNFDRTAVYAEAIGTPTTVDVESIFGFGSGFADDQITDAAAELMAHIPEEWADSCYQSLRPPLFFGTAEAVVTCFIGEPGDDGAEVAEYAAFLTPELMDAAYQRRVETFGTGNQADSCEEGAGERSYHFGSQDSPAVGRLLCDEQFRGIRYDWTDTSAQHPEHSDRFRRRLRRRFGTIGRPADRTSGRRLERSCAIFPRAAERAAKLSSCIRSCR